MKTTQLGIWVTLAMTFGCFGLRAEPLAVPAWTVGGGGASTGGLYTLEGAVGQPTTGELAGGPYAVACGFWSLVAAIQTPGAPVLAIHHLQTGEIEISWPATESEWQLQFATSLTGAQITWIPVPTPVQANGDSLHLIEPMSAGTKFYRLERP